MNVRKKNQFYLYFQIFLDASNDTSTDDNDEHLTEKESLIKKILELQRTVEDVENKVKKVRCQFNFLIKEFAQFLYVIYIYF